MRTLWDRKARMKDVLTKSWALLLGVGLLMIGNGLVASLFGIRGTAAGFSTFELAIINSAYFVGFLGSARLTPHLLRRVGHVRVFAALGSLISAAVILFPLAEIPAAWTVLRMILGFCFCGVYITAESWLNNSATNDTRGQALSAYMIVQTGGVIASQGLLNLPDPTGFFLFILPSILVSISFAPILLSVAPSPAFETTRASSLREVFHASPLTFVGMFLMGGIFAAQFGMSAVYGTQIGLSIAQVSVFVAMIFVGALVMQYPIGWLSDRTDRRVLILAVAVIGGVAGLAGFAFGGSYPVLLAVAFVVGGASNPLYSLFIAYLNDYLEPDAMAGASAGLLFINGVGAIAGPPITALLMNAFGPQGFWVFVAALLLAVAAYAAYRMTQRASGPVEDQSALVAVMPAASPVVLEAASEVYSEAASEDGEDVAASAQERLSR